MVQNVFTFSHRIAGECQGETHDFSGDVNKLTSQGWILKQISSSVYNHGSSTFIAVTVLAEKVE